MITCEKCEFWKDECCDPIEWIDDNGEDVCRYREGAYAKGKQPAASPWTYRDSNGDGSGEVVETAELPGWNGKLILIRYRSAPQPYTKLHRRIGIYTVLLKFKLNQGGWWMNEQDTVTTDWLRKHLIAWAVIHGGK